MTGFSVRLVEEHNVDLVWRLICDMCGSHQYIGASKIQLEDQLRKSWVKCFIVESNSENRTVGFCMASLAFDTWTSYYPTITALYIKPEYRRMHLATALVTAVCRFARDELKAIQLDYTILASNLHVAKMLLGLGFHNLTQAEESVSFRLDSKGLTCAMDAKLRPEIYLEGSENVVPKSNARYIVRPASVTDVKDVLVLIVDLASFQGFPDDVLVTPEILTGLLESSMCNCMVAIETSKLQLVGMVVSWCFLTIEDGVMTHVEDIFISPQHRGGGVGKALMIGTLRWATRQGATAVDLRTQKWNSKAQQVYKALGFQEDHLRRPITDFRLERKEMEDLLRRPAPETVEFCF